MEITFEQVPVEHFSDRLAEQVDELIDQSCFLDETELVDLVQRIAEQPELWKPLVIVDENHRRYELLYEDDRVDVWVLSWMPGQRTGFHDHDRSSVGLVCAQGVLDEGSLTIDNEVTVRMTPGVGRSGPGGYIHAVAHHSGEPAVSIHAYSPPLVCVGQYRADTDGRLRREIEHGRKELKDASNLGDSRSLTSSSSSR